MIGSLGGSIASSKISSIETEQLLHPTSMLCVWMGLLEPSIPPIHSELTLPALTSLGYPCMQLAPAPWCSAQPHVGTWESALYLPQQPSSLPSLP